MSNKKIAMPKVLTYHRNMATKQKTVKKTINIDPALWNAIKREANEGGIKLYAHIARLLRDGSKKQ